MGILYIQLPAPWPSQYKLITRKSNCATYDSQVSDHHQPTSVRFCPPSTPTSSSTSFAMAPPKVDSKKSAKSAIPSGIPSAGISSTRSGKECIISDYYQNYSKKTGTSPTESPKSAASSPPSTPSPAKSQSKSETPNKSPKTPDLGSQNPSTPVPGAQTSPPPQDGDVLAPSQGGTAASDEAMDNVLPPSVESSVMALRTSDDDQETAPVFELDLEPNPETLEPSNKQDPDLSLESNVLQNPTLDKSPANALGAQALLLAPSLPSPKDEPCLSTEVLNLPKPCQTSNSTTIQPTTLSSSRSSPSVPSSIQHFNTSMSSHF